MQQTPVTIVTKNPFREKFIFILEMQREKEKEGEGER